MNVGCQYLEYEFYKLTLSLITPDSLFNIININSINFKISLGIHKYMNFKRLLCRMDFVILWYFVYYHVPS
jgi:hypothetical protein